MLVHGGVALFYNFFKEVDDVPELRPWVGLRFLGPRAGGFAMSNYFRLETRVFYLKDDDQWDTVVRGRWQVQVNSPSFDVGSLEGLFALTSIELFADLGSSFDGTLADRFRYNIGIAKSVLSNLVVELDYLFHRIRLDDEVGSLQRDDSVVRLRMFYTIN